MPVLQIIAAVLLPPLGVYLARGIGSDFWINVLLTLLPDRAASCWEVPVRHAPRPCQRAAAGAEW